MKPYYSDELVTLYHGDALAVLREIPDSSVNCCVTSPPYFGLRDYGHTDQIGLEPTPEEFVSRLVEVFREVRRVLRDDGTLWLNLGDSYAGPWGAQGRSGAMADRFVISARQIAAHPHNQSKTGSIRAEGVKPKDLYGIPWRVAFALQSDGWYLRQDIIWHKPNPMPESVTDRCTKAHEYVFLLSKSARYYFDAAAIREPDSGQQHNRNVYSGAPSLEPSGGIRTPHGGLWGDTKKNGEGRNKRSVWTIATQPFSGAHFATFPLKLVEPCILAGCTIGGTVLDPFFGAGTVGLVATENGCKTIGIEISEKYCEIIVSRLGNRTPSLFGGSK